MQTMLKKKSHRMKNAAIEMKTISEERSQTEEYRKKHKQKISTIVLPTAKTLQSI